MEAQAGKWAANHSTAVLKKILHFVNWLKAFWQANCSNEGAWSHGLVISWKRRFTQYLNNNHQKSDPNST